MNLLQSTSMAYPLVNESNVYLCSGSPMPNDMETIYNSLLNDNLSTCVEKVGSMSKEKGYALQDIIKDLTTLVLATEIEGDVLGDILDGMSNVEHQLGVGTDEGLQLRALVGVFVKARCDMGA
jgi:replication factor C subunit 3/5